MVDEDFVMGYVCGYNDGIGSGGGGSGGAFSEIVIEKNYLFNNSVYGVATIDFEKSHFWRQGGLASWAVENPDGDTQYRTIWGPVNSRIYLWGYAMTKNGKVIGVVLSDISFANLNEQWSYATGEWVKTGETIPVIGKCSIVKADSSTEKNLTYQMTINVDGNAKTQWLATKQLTPSGWNLSIWYGHAPHLMSDAEYAAWFTAFAENGIILEEV